MPTTRSSFLAMAAAGIALSPTVLRAQTSPDVIRVATVPIDAGAQAYYAADAGFFRDAGLNVVVQPLTTGAAIGAALISGSLELGFSNLLSLAAAREHGLALQLLFPGSLYLGRSPATVLLVAPDSPIRDAKDLNGLTVGVPGLGNVTGLGALAWSDQHGGDAKSLKFVEFPPAELPAAVEQHRVSAAIVTEPFVTASAGKVRQLAPGMSSIGNEFVIGGWIVSKAWADAHRATALKLADVFAKTARWANTHHTESGVILSKYTNLAPDLASRMVRTAYAEKVDLTAIQVELDAAVKYGFLKNSVSAADLLWTPPK
jgi:NitT/TauT family transport system substrate-binding protein